MTTEKFTFFTYKLISNIDSGKHIPIFDIKTYIEEGTIFSELFNIIDVPPNHFTKEQQNKLLESWQNFNNAYSPEDLGIKNNGLCLLLSYIIHDIKEILNY
ncbi:MAG: hypothetical protein U9R23_03860 [Candidatus Cloacimonadota bacterium]|nr:hypothetical protein [Candidatus Cloacimonadota bacterium]